MGKGAIYKSFVTTDSELDRLFALPFKECAKKISTMDTMKKADTAAQIQPILDNLYAQVDRYGNPNYSRDEQIGPEMFIHLMSKIKRWETLLYWLYEIDIMMEETELDKLIEEAHKRYEAVDYDDNATRIRYKPIETEDGKIKKQRTVVNVREDLTTLIREREARGNHTEEIMNQAKQLANKYFK